MSDALQAHMWPSMEMGKRDSDQQTRSKVEPSGKASAAIGGGTGGTEGEESKDKERTVPREGLEDLETKAAASLSGSKEESRNKVGEKSFS